MSDKSHPRRRASGGPEGQPTNAAHEAWRRGVGTARRLWNSYKPIIDLAGGTDATILVAGSGRSGTTWIGAVLASLTSARLIFEPLRLDHEKQASYQRYIRPDSGTHAPFHDPVRDILSGRIRNARCDKDAAPGVYRRRVVKEIRANLLLAWIARTWPDLKIVWVVRHPIDVIHSQIERKQQGWKFDWSPGCVLDQPEVVADWLGAFVPRMQEAKSLPERLAHKWCIETFVPTQQNVASHAGALCVKYEDLARGPEAWRPIQGLVSNSDWDPRRFESVLRTRSRTSAPLAQSAAPAERYPLLTTSAQRNIMAIVADYGLSGLYPAETDREARP